MVSILESSVRPQPTHVSECEGSEWVPWTEWKSCPVPGPEGKRAHAIKFDDDSVFDLSGGWAHAIKFDDDSVFDLSGAWRLKRESEPRIDGAGWADAAFADDVSPSHCEQRLDQLGTRAVGMGHV